MSTITSSFPRIPTIYYTDLPAPSRRASNVPFLASASRIHHTTSPTNINNTNNMSMSAVSLMPRHNLSMIRPSRTISMPVRQTPKRVPLPMLTVPSQAPLTSTSSSSSSSSTTYSTYASSSSSGFQTRSGRRTAPVLSYASAASSSASASASTGASSTPGRTSIASTTTTPSPSLVPSTTSTNSIAREQREARAKAVAVLLLNRAGLSGRRRRTYFGPRQYVRSSLSECILSAEETVEGFEGNEAGVELVGGEFEKVGSVVEVNA